jgi:hypothetical protein
LSQPASNTKATAPSTSLWSTSHRSTSFPSTSLQSTSFQSTQSLSYLRTPLSALNKNKNKNKIKNKKHHQKTATMSNPTNNVPSNPTTRQLIEHCNNFVLVVEHADYPNYDIALTLYQDKPNATAQYNALLDPGAAASAYLMVANGKIHTLPYLKDTNTEGNNDYDSRIITFALGNNPNKTTYNKANADRLLSSAWLLMPNDEATAGNFVTLNTNLFDTRMATEPDISEREFCTQLNLPTGAQKFPVLVYLPIIFPAPRGVLFPNNLSLLDATGIKEVKADFAHKTKQTTPPINSWIDAMAYSHKHMGGVSLLESKAILKTIDVTQLTTNNEGLTYDTAFTSLDFEPFNRAFESDLLNDTRKRCEDKLLVDCKATWEWHNPPTIPTPASTTANAPNTTTTPNTATATGTTGTNTITPTGPPIPMQTTTTMAPPLTRHTLPLGLGLITPTTNANPMVNLSL